MPRKRALQPAHQLHKATGQGVVRIAGKCFYTGRHGTPESEAEYNRLIGQWIAQGRPDDFTANTKASSDRFTVIELCAAYWRFAQTYYVKDGVATDEQPGIKAALRALKAIAGDKAADDVGPRDIKLIQAHCIGRGNSRKYINKLVGRIRRAFKWAASEELIAPATYHAMTTVSGLAEGRTEAKECEPVMPVDDDLVEATIPHLKDDLQAMVKLQRLTGMRPMEVCRIAPKDIDTSGDIWLYRVPSNKMSHKGRERIVAIGPKGQMLLRCRMDREYCFLTNRGNPYNSRRYRDRIRAACKRAGLEPWNPNQLRHAAATEIRRDYGLEAAQVILGHSKADTTQIYAERNLGQAIDIAAKCG